MIGAAFSDAISHSEKQFDRQMFRLNMVKKVCVNIGAILARDAA